MFRVQPDEMDAFDRFIMAAKDGRGLSLQIVQQYIAENPEGINQRDQYGDTALYHASANGHLSIVKELLAVPGIQVNLVCSSGAAALNAAIKYDRISVVEALLETDEIDVNVGHQFGITALQSAVRRGIIPIVTKLLDKISNIDDFRTAIFHADEHGQEGIKLMLQSRIAALEKLPVHVPTFRERLKKIAYKGEIRPEFLCPILHDVMDDPVTVSSGVTYDRAALREWFIYQGYPRSMPCPITRKPSPINRSELDTFGVNLVLRGLIETFVENAEKNANAAKKRKKPSQHGESRFFNSHRKNKRQRIAVQVNDDSVRSESVSQRRR